MSFAPARTTRAFSCALSSLSSGSSIAVFTGSPCAFRCCLAAYTALLESAFMPVFSLPMDANASPPYVTT